MHQALVFSRIRRRVVLAQTRHRLLRTDTPRRRNPAAIQPLERS